MEFYQTLNVLDEIVQIILEFEIGKYDSSVIRRFEQGHYPTDDKIEEIRVKCRCEEYIEVSALKGDNLEELMTAICRTAIKRKEQGPLTTNQQRKCRCIVL